MILSEKAKESVTSQGLPLVRAASQTIVQIVVQA